jgi:hypothetical protein
MIKGFVWGLLIILAVWFFYGCARASGFVSLGPRTCPACVKQAQEGLQGSEIKYWQTVDNKVQYY